MSKTKLPADLYAAYEWIESAGEWTEALESPAAYAASAANNAHEHNVADVNESDLLEAIEWKRFARLTPSQQAAYHEYVSECREAGTSPELRSFCRDLEVQS